MTGGHLAAAAALLLALAACSSGDEPLKVVDPNAAPANPTWEQVEAIIVPNCSPCHKDGGDDKTGNRLRLLDDGEDQDYSTCEGIREGIPGIVKTVLREGSMPPGAWPRIGEREKLIIERWIQQGGCSPCSPCD